MKKYLLFCVPALVCFTQTAFAQLQLVKPTGKKELPMPFPDKLVIPASTKIIPAHIPDIKKPFVLSPDDAVNNVRDFINKARAQCRARKSPAPTLVLDAERASNLTAALKWETKYAFAASGFHIERSLGDSFHFVTVNFAAVAAGRASKKNYQLHDYNDYKVVSFYRIKQLNNEGAYSYSNIASVPGYDVAPFRIYPNPTSAKIWLEMTTALNGNVQVMLYDASGKLIRQEPVNCTKGTITTKSLNVSRLAAGVYQVKVRLPDNTFLAGNFIKQ
ncbi:MAG TPA: T9SS type A sorting domain-containing protein [Parafilimonas sp.]|nr:T9SS type A sorting domain-containing protein [Parafilimonas sp.]